MYKVAVVEDEITESELICKMISDIGENWSVVAKAYSGPEALEKVNKTDPDVVLLDINIPEINGLQVLKRIKEQNPQTSVIIVTAYNEFDFAHQAIKYKVDDFLLKPIRPTQLYDSLNSVVKDSEADIENKINLDINKILFNVVNRSYLNSIRSLRKFVDNLYIYNETNLSKIQFDTFKFLDKLGDATHDLFKLPTLEYQTRLKANPTIFKNPYELYLELKKVINLIFDYVLEHETQNDSIENILNYIDRNCHKDISLNQVGEFANMSSYYLSKIFKKETGINFVTYLTDRKIEIAKDMLVNTNIPIINIALELSYHEPNYFSKVFKKATGMTPTEYRRNKKKTF